MNIRVFLCAPVVLCLESAAPSAQHAFTRMVLLLFRGEIARKAQLLAVHAPGMPVVWELSVMRALRAYLTVTLTPTGPCVVIWGLRYVRKQGDRCYFPYGGPWFGGRYAVLETRTTASLEDLAQAMVAAGAPASAAAVPAWLPLHEADAYQAGRATAVAYRAAAQADTPAPPLIALREAMHRAASALAAGLPVATRPDPLVCGVMPVVLTAQPGVGEALARLLDPADAVLCMAHHTLGAVTGKAPFWYEDALPAVRFDRVLVLFGAEHETLPPPPWQPGAPVAGVGALLARLQKAAALARRGLVVCVPDDAAALFAAPPFRGRVVVTDDPAVARAVLTGPEDVSGLQALGDIFQAAGCARAAVACFAYTGDEKARLCAEARVSAAAGETVVAAEAYAAALQWSAAGRQYAQAGLSAEALAAFGKVRDVAGIRRMRAAMMAEEGAYLQLGLLYARAKMWRPALHAYLRACAYDKAAALWAGPLNDPVRALEAYRAAGCFDKAARLAAAGGRTAMAVHYFLRGGLIEEAGRLMVRRGGSDAIRRFHRKYGDEAQYLYLVESEGDLEATLEVLRRWDPERVRREAEAYADQGDAFRAHARFLVLDDAAQAGTWAMKLQRYEEAADWFTRVGDHRAAGIALGRAGAYTRALCSFLADDGELPHFARARRMLPKIRDRAALKTLVAELFAAGAWARAAWLCARLKDHAGVAVASLCEDQQEETARALAAMRGYHELERLCALCVDHGLVKQGMEQVLRADPCYGEWLRGRVSETHTPSLFVLAKQYFAQHPNHRLKMRWALRLKDRDRHGVTAHAAFLAFESVQDIRLCLEVAFRWMEDAPVWRGLLRAFAAELRDYVGQPPAYGLRCYFLGKTAAVDEVLAHLAITDDNAPLFLLRACSPAMTARYLALCDWDRMPEGVYPDDPGLRRVADRAARGHAWKAAALCHVLAGRTEEALACLRKRHDPLTGARLNLLLGRLPEALAGFEQVEPRPLADLAEVYEALHKYKEAYACFKELGDLKGARRCRRRLMRIGLLKPRL